MQVLWGLGGMVAVLLLAFALSTNRRPDIATLGIRAVLAATLANLMSAAIAGMLIG